MQPEEGPQSKRLHIFLSYSLGWLKSFKQASQKEDALRISEELKSVIGAKEVTFNDNVSKVSIVGAGMLSNPGVAAMMFEALGENNINISMISTSEIKISVLIEQDLAKKAVNAIHDKFDL